VVAWLVVPVLPLELLGVLLELEVLAVWLLDVLVELEELAVGLLVVLVLAELDWLVACPLVLLALEELVGFLAVAVVELLDLDLDAVVSDDCFDVDCSECFGLVSCFGEDPMVL